MRKRDEGTLRLIENYKKEFDAGLSPKEIAEKYGVSLSTMYRAVLVVAEKEGVSRESLLKRANSKDGSHTEAKNSTLLDNEDFNARGMAILKEIKEARIEINNFISKHEKIAESFKNKEV